MTFSVQQNPYFPMYPVLPLPAADPNFAQKAMAFRQSLDTRLPNPSSLDLINSILATCVSAKNQRNNFPKLPYPPLGSLFSSPGWFQQALTSLQAANLPLSRQLPEDLSLPTNPSKQAETSHASHSRSTRKQPGSGSYKNKSHTDSYRSERSRLDPILCSQPTFYPLIRDQAERVHQSWKLSGQSRVPPSPQFHETGTLVPSLINGEVIMGFNVWGEKRLCLPHLFRFVLNDVDLKAIDEACTKLQITCTTCSPAQLTLLHARKILPPAVSSCGLIRKSDAERLTKFIRNRVDLEKSRSSPNKQEKTHLLHRAVSVEQEDSDVDTSVDAESSKDQAFKLESPDHRPTKRAPKSHSSSLSAEPIPVIHECFGSQLGLIHPELYTEATAKCIECQTCHRFFATDQFVGHTHRVTEVDNLNHWGFDSSNWRCYLRLYTGKRSLSVHPITDGSDDEFSQPDSNLDVVEAHRRLEEFKVKFAQPIRLPASLSAALRTVGLCASVAPILSPVSSNASQLSKPSDTSTRRSIVFPKFAEPNKENSGTSSNFTVSHPNSTPASLPNLVLPQLTLRRLWAPNDGCIRVPPPPVQKGNRLNTALPKRLHTGPPLLLDSHRVIPQEAADQYDQDFIPNVCLMPALNSKSGGFYCHRLSKGNPGASASSSRSSSRSSSGNRSRSVSVSSASSSCCTRTQHPFGRIRMTPSRNSSVASEHSIHVDDDPLESRIQQKRRTRSWSHRRKRRSLSGMSDSFYSDSVINLYASQAFARKHRRCHSLSPHSNERGRLSRMNSPFLGKVPRTKMSARKRGKPREKHTHQCSHRSAVVCQERAIAAAKAAQGAASRISPGLWSRHFANLNGFNKGPLNLPNAREPCGPGGDGPSADHSMPKPMSPNFSSSATPVLVTNPNKNSLPAAVLALESVWADLVRHINEYTIAVESKSGVNDARQRLFQQFIAMQTCYATHIASLMKENQKLSEQLVFMQSKIAENGRNHRSSSRERTVQERSLSADVPDITDQRNQTNLSFGDVQTSSSRTASPSKIYPHRNRKHPRLVRERHSPICSEQSQTELTQNKSNNDDIHHLKRRANCVQQSSSVHQYQPLKHHLASSPTGTPEFNPPAAPVPTSTSSATDSTDENSPVGFRVERLSNSVSPPSPSFLTHPAKRLKSSEAEFSASAHPSEDSIHDKSRFSSNYASLFQPPLKRRSLLPPGEFRPRLTLKPQPRPPPV